MAIGEITRWIDLQESKFLNNNTLLENFAEEVQTSIANDKFTFTDIPDIILKHKPEYNRAECDRLTEFLIKVKNLYLERKLEEEKEEEARKQE